MNRIPKIELLKTDLRSIVSDLPHIKSFEDFNESTVESIMEKTFSVATFAGISTSTREALSSMYYKFLMGKGYIKFEDKLELHRDCSDLIKRLES